MSDSEKITQKAEQFIKDCFDEEEIGSTIWTDEVCQLLADFAEAETQRLREANAVLMGAVKHYAAKEKWQHDHPVSVEPMREHLHGSNKCER